MLVFIALLICFYSSVFFDRSKDISNLDSLKSLQYCTLLRKLDMRGNPCCQSSSYREEVKSILANLQELDGHQI